MKVAILAMMIVGSASAFVAAPSSRYYCPSSSHATTTTSLNLFGQGNKDGAKKGGPGMMDQLAMFKKAQEVAQKKQALDKELQEMDFKVTAAGGGVSAVFKYVPIKNPMDPNPDYEMVTLEFDDDYYESVSPEDLSKDIMAAYRSGVEETNKAVMEKYQSLTKDLGEVLGAAQQGGGSAPPPPQS
jgi:DNA-binding protein YbaB